MPTWNQIQSQLRNPQNPVVFFDISVGRTVSVFFVMIAGHNLNNITFSCIGSYNIFITNLNYLHLIFKV